ncbi:hypothetical protein C8F04DRAFT_338071 [Mycena alexandri]|uniref:Uncharacterized protein n=1 Tax=Mycena alexandri TaxID=1745969 RepID=A0AAD6TH66_9AGAR|nr:hypothetical protein C8F04DRAFT_338071 [Mycena alexandri]
MPRALLFHQPFALSSCSNVVRRHPTMPPRMYKFYDENGVPDIMPFPELALVATTKGQETAVPKLNDYQRSWIHDVALRNIQLAGLDSNAAKILYDKIKSDAFDAKAFQHTVQPGDGTEEAQLPALVAAWNRESTKKNKKATKNPSGRGGTGNEPQEEDEGGRVGLLRGYTKAGWRLAIQKVISNKRTAKKDTKNNTTVESTPPVTPALALSKLYGLSVYSGRDKFRDECRDEINAHADTIPGDINQGGKFRKAEAQLWAQEDQAVWEAAAASNEGVDWKERQNLVAGGFRHMVDALHSTGKFRPFVATMQMCWVDGNGVPQLDWVEAVPDAITIRQPFEKQYAEVSQNSLNSLHAWAGKALQDYLAGDNASTRHAPPVFPVSAEALDDMSPNMVAQTVTSFLGKSYQAAFASRDIPWSAIARAPNEYYDTAKFDLAFSSDGLGGFKSIQWHALALTLASGAGDGSSGFFRKARVAGEEADGEAEAARLEREAEDVRREHEAEAVRPEQEEEAARLEQLEDVRRKQEAEAARLEQEAEAARLEQEAEAARLEQEAEVARLEQEAEAARLEQEAEAARLEQEEKDARREREVEGIASGGKRGKKRSAETQLVPADVGRERRSTRKHQTPEEAKLEREQKLVSAAGTSKKPSFEYVAKSPIKPKPRKRRA